LYGTTRTGGANNQGTIFALNDDGSGFHLLHSFAPAAGDGKDPLVGMALDGTTLYGTTHSGGASNGGTVFAINIDGSGYDVLHNFGGVSGAPIGPHATVTPFGSRLYGTTYNGGPSNTGTAYSLKMDGTGFQVLNNFVPASPNGYFVDGGLTVAGLNLYGTTASGGAHGFGTVFAITVPEPSTWAIACSALLAIGLLAAAGKIKDQRGAVTGAPQAARE
jgi:uncharacterized repeat protein (TIGR03803 family)